MTVHRAAEHIVLWDADGHLSHLKLSELQMLLFSVIWALAMLLKHTDKNTEQNVT